MIDSATNKPLGFVTIALLDPKTNQPVKSSITKDDGSFQIIVSTGIYKLGIVSVGYKNKMLPVTANDTVINIGKILLSLQGTQLNEVSVSSVKPLMKQEVDRISYDVQADPESKSLTALDMMRKVPLLTVDANDAIKLKGSGNYKILVNGKESALMAKNPSDILKSMPGTNIVRIEVITTPPAKYDAEGLVGIINIITKKTLDEGYNIGVNTRYNTLWGPGLNLNGTVKEGKLGFSAYTGTGIQHVNHNPYGTTQTFFNNYVPNGNVLKLPGNNIYSGNYKYASAELSYEIDTLNLLTASGDFSYNLDNQQNIDTLTLRNKNTGVINQQYSENNIGHNRSYGYDAGLDYQLGFKRSKDQLLTISYNYSYSPSNQSNNILLTNTINYPQPNFNQFNSSGSREHTIQVDYAQPLTKQLSLEAGGKGILTDNFSDFNTDTVTANGNYVLNSALANSFNYHQNVYSIYNSYQLKLDKWVAKGGYRLERTTINADFASTNSSFSTDYNNLIPSISIQRTFGKNTLNFGFTERIQRPQISQLNPYIDRSNPNFITTGNPRLNPELNHVFELNYSNYAKGSVNIGLSYAFSNNSIQSVTSIDTALQRDISSTTYRNVGTNKNLGLNINTNYPITPKLQLSLNGQLSYVWLTGDYNEQSYKNSGFTGNVFTNLSYKFTDGYRIGINAGYFSGQVNLQGKSSSFVFNQAVLSKEFLNKKLVFSLVANNPESRYWHGYSYVRTPDFYTYSDYNQLYRSFQVRLSYKFGRLNSDIKKSEHGINGGNKGGDKG